MTTSKSVKGVGTWQVTLVPRRNFFNLIFPNDVVNIYVDPGDGQRGFVRVMLGYVDRIERTQAIANPDTGSTNTNFIIMGSDFAKAVERTDVYWNPNMETRPDLQSDLASSNLGGSALRTKGIVAHGTPADMVETLLELLLGFGAQWILPTSYPPHSILDNKNQRLQRTLDRVPSLYKEKLAKLGIDLSKLDAKKDKTLKKLLAEVKDTQGVTNIQGIELKKEELSDFFSSNSAVLAAAYTAESRSLQTTILDLMSLSFIEAMSIDGYISSDSIWSSEGPLLSIINGFTNNIVNELCFDLRPVVEGGDGCFGDTENPKYSKEADELGINVRGGGKGSGFEVTVAAVKYVPAVIFREYPYSVVEGLDLKGYYILGASLDFIPFGPIFSKRLFNSLTSSDVSDIVALTGERTGRLVYQYDNESGVKSINPEPCIFESKSKPWKHLDVIAITSKGDVTSSQVGRSDNDVFNLFSLASNDFLYQDVKIIIRDFLPILNPVSIARNGLRTFLPQTRFANYSRDLACKEGSGSAIDSTVIRGGLIRWSLLLDHWNQHNNEYLTGTITLRGMPEIRVGYRLDWLDHNESYYVEQVNHTWKYPDGMTTTVQVSRGQRNDPFPAYIPPVVANKNAGAKIEEETISHGPDDTSDPDAHESVVPGKQPGSVPFKLGSPTVADPGIITPKGRWGLVREYRNGFHHGLDFQAGTDDDIKSVADGKILQFGYQKGDSTISASNSEAQNHRREGYGGLLVKIKHTGGFVSVYMHLNSFKDTLKEGDEVGKGDIIGKAGSTGSAGDGPHLHFEFRNPPGGRDDKIDPTEFFENRPINATPGKQAPVNTEKSEPKVITLAHAIPSNNLLVKQGGGDRSEKGRLSKYFPIKDTRATAFATNKGSGPADTQFNNQVDTKLELENDGKAYELAYPNKHKKNS
jgi:murein DD-endopeptidase MepM/ murein hydrolase activator NlpD